VKVEAIAVPLQLVQMGQQRCVIFGPEDDAVYVLRTQRDGVDLATEGVRIAHHPGPQAVHQPGRVEGGDISSAAGGDNVHPTI
jgi:hypothetical protein